MFLIYTNPVNLILNDKFQHICFGKPQRNSCAVLKNHFKSHCSLISRYSLYVSEVSFLLYQKPCEAHFLAVAVLFSFSVPVNKS